jgi:plasmid stabilization system protein ParE
MNKLAISPEARKDIEGIKEYINDELKNPVAAVNTVSRIIKKIKTLPKTPGIGVPLSSKVSFDTDYRFLICGNYLAFYRFENKTIYVDRVLYGRRDYVKILFPELKNDDNIDKIHLL